MCERAALIRGWNHSRGLTRNLNIEHSKRAGTSGEMAERYVRRYRRKSSESTRIYPRAHFACEERDGFDGI